MTQTAAPARNDVRTAVLCYLATLVEGYDLQSAGAVAPKFAPELRLDPGQTGWVFTSNTLGLFIGAAFGGWIADRIGRKWVLVISMVMFGLFTLGTAISQSYEVLVAMRFLTGLGLGAALPNIIALTAESSPPGTRASRVTLMSSGITIGGAIAVAVVLFGPQDLHWRTVFALGGWAPILLAPFIAIFLRESTAFEGARAQRRALGAAAPSRASGAALFGEGRATGTLLLWLSFFFTTVVLYLMINWLPTLMVAKGFSRHDAAIANFVFALGSAVGSFILGYLTTRMDRRVLFLVTYLGCAAGLFGLTAVGSSLLLASVASFMVGFFVIGGQFLLYGVAPTLYASQVRATGTGWAVAIARLGAVVGPAMAGLILSNGGGPSQVLYAMLPGLVIAAAASVALVWRPAAET